MPDPSEIRADVLLCDHAEVQNGKLFINGAGITHYWVDPQPPHSITVHVAAVIQVPYTATNQPHTLRVTLVDQDGNPTVPWRPQDAPEANPIEVEASFNVGRPPTLTQGDSQSVPLSFAFNPIPLAELGRYSFQVALDGTELRRLPLRVLDKRQRKS